MNNVRAATSVWSLQGKRALITGATKGIGQAIAEEMLHLGASITIVARQEEEVMNQVEAYRKQNFNAWGIAADVSQASGRQRVVQAVKQDMKGVDILVNNVGANIRKSTLDYTLQDYNEIMQVNLESTWGLCQALYPLLIGGGSIVNIGSVASQRALSTSTAAYAMSKAAQEQLTRYLAAEWGSDGIRVNTVLPWYTRTLLAGQVLQDEAKRNLILSHTPMGRIGEPEEVARAACFLAMPAAAYITGVCLPVDGGFLSRGI